MVEGAHEVLTTSLIVNGLQAITFGVQNYRNIKEIMQDVLRRLDKKSDVGDWSIYFNALEGFKISWPSQRWLIREIEGVLPLPSLVSAPIQIRFKLAPPTVVPNVLDPAMTLFHNLVVKVDRHGSMNMESYVKAALQLLSTTFAKFAEFKEERSGRRVDENNAVIAGRLVYKPPENLDANNTGKGTSVSLWKLLRIIRSGDRMYTLTGTLVDTAGMEEIALKDMMEIVDSFSSLK
jgi:hypothetical protein